MAAKAGAGVADCFMEGIIRVPGHIRFFLHVLVLSMFLVGSVYADCPAGDLNGDCRIDFLDVNVFAKQWLEPSESSAEADIADLDGVDGVNLSDFALLVGKWHTGGIPLIINEIMASNDNTISDPQGDFDDWIEIYNSGGISIDVGGMYLTDDLDEPMMWRFPVSNPTLTTIPAGGYLLIWADEDSSNYGLHANFKLNADGEQLGLFGTDGLILIDSISFPEQTADISYGHDPDTNGQIRFFATPTPGARNDGAYLGQVEEPEFSHERGFYDSPFYLTLATETKDAVIYYTLDGSEPYEFKGRFPNGTIYTGPISISRNTCLRARAIKQGFKPSAIITNTYLLNANDTVKSLPVISLVGDEGKTFYEPDGVMAIVGGYYSGDGTWVSDSPDSYNIIRCKGEWHSSAPFHLNGLSRTTARTCRLIVESVSMAATICDRGIVDRTAIGQVMENLRFDCTFVTDTAQAGLNTHCFLLK